MVKVHTHESIARLENRHEYRHVGLCAGVGLHICILGAEKFFQTVDGKLFGLVNHLAAAIIAVAGITLGIFVCEAGTHGLHHLV